MHRGLQGTGLTRCVCTSADILTQIPGAAAIQRWGAKVMMSIDMAVTAALCLAIPLVTRSAGPRVLAPLLTVIGLSQGPLIPANQVLKRNWLRDGPSKALILRLMAVPPMISDILADTVYPILCVSFGWQAMPYIHGACTAAFLVLWHFLVTDKPQVAAPDPTPDPTPRTQAKVSTKTVEWRIFTLAPVISVMMAKFGSGVLSYSLEQWAPIYFVRSHIPPAAHLRI